ncbi:MAG: DNA polymerase III subunit delta [Oscillospiraceae bacterium]
MAAKSTAIRLTTEAQLKSELKEGRLRNLYFLFGEESYLTTLYQKRIVKTALGDEPDDMNYTLFNGAPEAETLMDYAESMPYFSEYKCIVISDLDTEKLDNKQHALYLELMRNLPETTVLIISMTSIEVDLKKTKAKLKKLLEVCEKHGCVCNFSLFSTAQAGAMVSKRIARNGCTISQENAAFLAEQCGRSMIMLEREADKLCAYAGEGGEITRETIDALTPRMIETSIYALSDALISGDAAKAFSVLDDLFAQQHDPVMLLVTLSSGFVDLYRAKLALKQRYSQSQMISAFKYPPNRSFLAERAMRSAARVSESYLAQSIEILYRTNLLLNSSKADRRIQLERAITEISALKRI